MDRELPLGIAVLISETLLGLECIFLGRFGKFTLGFEIEFAFLEIHVLPKIEVVAEFLLILIESAKILKHPGLKPKPLGIILLLLGFQGSFWLLWRLRGHVRFAQPKGLIVLIALVALHKSFVLPLSLLFLLFLKFLGIAVGLLLPLHIPVGSERSGGPDVLNWEFWVKPDTLHRAHLHQLLLPEATAILLLGLSLLLQLPSFPVLSSYNRLRLPHLDATLLRGRRVCFPSETGAMLDRLGVALKRRLLEEVVSPSCIF